MTPEELTRITATVMGDLDEALGPLAASYERILRGAGRKMARRTKRYSQGTPDAVTAAVHHPDEDEVIPKELAGQVQRLTKRERAKLVKLLIAAYEAHEVAFDVRPTLSEALMEKIGEHASFAAEKDLRDVYRGVIQTAAEEGYSIPRTANAITEAVDGVAAYRATALARTDLIGLANGASMGIATEAFAGRDDVTKVWLATEDDRTRETHIDANGQEVPLNEYFDVGGYPAMYPGDPDLPDEEVINCRCTVIYSGGGADGTEVTAEDAEVASSFQEQLVSAMMEAIPNPGEPSATTVFTVPAEFADRIRLEASGASPTLPAMDTDAQTAAVTITVADEAAQPATEPARTPWEGILAIEGHPTSDGRYLLPGEIGHRDLPLPFAASHEKQHETETAGRIETIEIIPVAQFDKEGFDLPEDMPERAAVIWGTGSFSANERGQAAIDELENGVGVSIDLPVDRKAFVRADTYEEVAPEDVLAESEDVMSVLFGGVPDGFLQGVGGKIGGVSLASIAAFEETTIRIVGDRALVASGYALRERVDEGPYFIEGLDTLLASAIEAPIAPPRSWFFREEPDEPTPVTILDTGEVYFHLALWHTCHAGRANGAFSSCMYAPHSPSNYSQFHLGAMLCDDGSEVAVGRITVGTGHAPLHLGAAAARKHYDHTGTCVAYGRMIDGVYGPFFCGVLKSDATPEQIRDFRACPPSGDWRAHDGRLELQAALAVNVPGYPVPRSQLALAASADSLEIASLILGPPDGDDRAEAIRMEHLYARDEGVDLLVELGAIDLLRDVALARRK